MQIHVTGGELPPEEIRAYIDHVRAAHPDRIITDITIHLDGDFVDLSYRSDPVPFERIRRITGYLVGKTTRWNSAKLAELGDRVKHR